MKKLFSLFTAFILSLTMMTSVGAIGLTPIEDETNLCIETAAVPDNVTTYAADIFMHMSKSVWSSFGICGSQLNNLSLSQGFRMISVNTMRYSDIAYYFLVYSGDSVVAIMTISNVNGKLGFQIERNLLTVDISERMRPSAQPYKIYVSDNAYYFVQNNRIIHTSTEEYLYDKDKIANDCAVISNNIASCSDNVMNTTIANTGVSVANCSFTETNEVFYGGEICNLVYIKNKTYMVEGEENPRGTCWASCVASLCYYYKKGCSGTLTDNDYLLAEKLRDDILDERFATNNGDYATNMRELVPFINERLPLYGYGNLSYYFTNSKLSWNSVMSSIGNKRPSVTGWYYYDNAKGEYTKGHAMVLSGYNFALHDPSLEQYHFLQLRNSDIIPIYVEHGFYIYPNSIVGYDSPYVDKNNPYVWNDTVLC